jgi:diguanylate cyclase (GGDEF)-like protein
MHSASTVASHRLRALLTVARALAQVDDEQLLLQLIAESAREALGYTSCVVAVRDDAGRFVVRAGSGCSKELLATVQARPWTTEVYELLAGAASRIGAVLWVPPEHPVRSLPVIREVIVPTPASGAPGSWRQGSLLFVPLSGEDGQVLGWLNPDDPAGGQLPTEGEAALLETFAHLASVALHLVQGRAAARTRAQLADAEHEQLRRLLGAMATVRGSLDLDAVLGEIARGVVRAGGFGRAAIYLRDEADPLLRVRATAGVAPEEDTRLRSTSVPMEVFLPLMDPAMLISRSYLFDHRRFTLPGELEELLSVPADDGRVREEGHWHPQDTLTVPLVDEDGRLSGVITVDEPDSGLLPDRAQIEKLEFFAEQCSIALNQARAHEEVRAMAELDPLTGLKNRRSLVLCLDREIAAARLTGRPCSVLFCDVDHFKRINDRHGHAQGDAVLVAVAQVMTERRRNTDLVARYGGEEFVIALPDTTSAAAARLAESVRRRVAEITGFDFSVRISIGVATFTGGPTDCADVLAAADQALYRAKQDGRDRVVASASA